MNEILSVSVVLFCIGLLGLLTRKDLLFMMLSIEIMFNASAFAIVGIACLLGHAEGQVMYLIIASVAAAEVAIALGLIVAYERLCQTTRIR